jgi:hypothetical protein
MTAVVGRDPELDRIDAFLDLAPDAAQVLLVLLLEGPRGAPVEPRAVAVALLAILRALARERRLLVAVGDVQWVDPPSRGIRLCHGLVVS